MTIVVSVKEALVSFPLKDTTDNQWLMGDKALHNMPQNYIYGLLKLSKTKAARSLHKIAIKKG